jgi:hypothetical protein
MSSLTVTYNSTSRNFDLVNCSTGARWEFQYGFAWAPISSADGYLLPLWSSELAESHIIQLINSENDRSIGWLCTASALTSIQHEFSESKFFRAAAGHAIQLLLEQNAVQEQLMQIPNPNIDLFPERTCIFIAQKSLIPEPLRIEPIKLLPQLHQYGFSSYDFSGKRTNSAGRLANANLISDGIKIKKLRLKSVSDTVPFLSFIGSLLSKPLSEEQDPPYRFFLYYQILELLMEEVQRNKQVAFVESLKSADGDATLLYELIQKLGEQTSEIARIVSLFHDYVSVASGELSGLKSMCLTFLDHMDRKGDIDDCGKALYKVRNMLIHNMRRITAEAYESLLSINDYLEVVIPSMLLTFTPPIVNSREST